MVVVINSDGKKSLGQDGPDIYTPPDISGSTPIITLGYERSAHYQSLREGLESDEPLRQALFKRARATTEKLSTPSPLTSSLGRTFLGSLPLSTGSSSHTSQTLEL